MQRSLVVLGLLAAAGTALLAHRSQQPVEPPVVRADTSHALGHVAAEGRVVAYPGAEVTVAAERGGRLVRLDVREGDAVRRGQVLAEIESDELKAALAEARARVTEAEAQLRLAARHAERRAALAAEGVVAAHDLDEAERDGDVARARLLTVRAEVGRLEAQLRKSRVLAPISGTVVLRDADAGETVVAGQALVTIADLDRLRVEGEADEADAAAVAVGAPVVITSDAYPGRRFPGRVEEVSDAVTGRRVDPEDPARPSDTRVLRVKVAFAEPAPLRLGTTVELQVSPAR